MPEVRCHACGASLPSGFAFCGRCGAALTPSGTDAPAPPATRGTTDGAARPEGQRRPLTVVFCDLVGSTDLAVALDPEDLGDVLRLYHRTACAALVEHGGTIARFLGDGILAYFGHPVALDDAPIRAVQGSLAAVEAVDALDTDLLRRLGLHLSCRSGIHSGMVLVQDMGAAGRVERDDVVGEVPNIAARLQGEAEPGQVVIGESTRLLLEGWFETTSLGPRQLKGLPAPMDVHVVDHRSRARSRLDASRDRRASFVGRADELARLDVLTGEVAGGASHLALLVGQPGIGKSRLAVEVVDRARRAGIVATVRAHGDVLASDTPLGAFADAIGALGRNDLEPEQHRARWLERVAAALLDGATDDGDPVDPASPVVVHADDVHWADATSLDLLAALHAHPRPTLVLATSREPAPDLAATAVVPVGPLADDEIRDLAGDHAGLVPELVARCDGVPLFLEETLRMLDAGDDAVVPRTLQDLLVARLDNVGPEARRVACAGSVAGRSFGRGELTAVLDEEHRAGVDGALSVLVDAGLVVERGDTWRFRHALLRETAYDVLLRSVRRDLHGRLAEHERDEHGDARPERLAQHLEAAERTDEAIAAWETAARRAQRRWFHAEAAAHLDRAIALVDRLPHDDGRDELELRLRSNQVPAVMALHDHAHPVVQAAIERTEPLARRLGGVGLLVLSMPMATSAQALGDYRRAEQTLGLARRAAEEIGLADFGDFVDTIAATFTVWQGDLDRAAEDLESSLAAVGFGLDGHDPRYGRDDPRLYTIAGSIGMAGVTAHLRDDAATADRWIAYGLEVTQASELREGTSIVAVSDAMRRALTAERSAAAEAAATAEEAVAEIGGRQWADWARCIGSWAEGDAESVAAGIDRLPPSGLQLRALLLALLADARGADDPRAGLAALDHAEHVLLRSGERMCAPMLAAIRVSLLERIGDGRAVAEAAAVLASRTTETGARRYARERCW